MSVSNPKENSGTKPSRDNYSKLTFAKLNHYFSLQASKTSHNNQTLISLSIFGQPSRKNKGKEKLHLLASISPTNPLPNQLQLGVPL